jgi:4-amino-4-deoxy-L-arabinose transferase-like glycosyltransferase
MLGTLVWSVYGSLTMFDTLLTTFVLLALNTVYTATEKIFATAEWLLTGLCLGLGVLDGKDRSQPG